MGPTYEIFVDVRHHPRYLEDNEKKLNECWKLVDTGDSDQMVADSLREFAAKIKCETGEKRSEDDIVAALNHCRAATMNLDFELRTIIIANLLTVARLLNIEWYGYGVD